MIVDRVVLAVLGVLVVTGVALAQLVHPYWIALTVFAGLNAVQISINGFCPLGAILKKAGGKTGPIFK